MRTFALLAFLVACSWHVAAQTDAPISAKVGGPIAPDGKTEIHCDLPGNLHMRNTGGSDGPRGPGSGSGLCVFTSAEHAARFQGYLPLWGFQKYMTHFPGGGTPRKLARYIKKYCEKQGVPEPLYIQIENSRDLKLLELATRNGFMVAATYTRSPTGRYNGRFIMHMVNVPHCQTEGGPSNKGLVAVLDNNYPGADKYEWMTTDEFLRVCNPRGIWAWILIHPSPPPVPWNKY